MQIVHNDIRPICMKFASSKRAMIIRLDRSRPRTGSLRGALAWRRENAQTTLGDLHVRAAKGLTCTTAVHICYGYGIQANLDWKETLGQEWRQYEAIFPAIAKSSIQQVSLECYHSHVPPHLMALLEGKDVMVGVIDVASDVVETPEQVAETIGQALQYVPRQRLFPCTNCGMVPMNRDIALAKLKALAAGAALARARNS